MRSCDLTQYFKRISGYFGESYFGILNYPESKTSVISNLRHDHREDDYCLLNNSYHILCGEMTHWFKYTVTQQ